jgi:signal transduction histidine kinase
MKSANRTLSSVTRWSNTNVFGADVLFALLIGSISMIGFFTADANGSMRQQNLWGVAVIVGQTIALSTRRVAPLRSLAAVLVFTVVFWMSDFPTNFDAFSLLAVYAATAHGGHDRRRVWRAVGGSVVLLTTIAVLGVVVPSDELPAAAVIGIAALHLTAAIAGQIVYDRRQRLAALEIRAARAETERELATRKAVLDERSRIARELHDVVAHGVSVMVVQAGAAQRLVNSQPELASEALEQIQATGREALIEMRRMLGVLRDEQHDVELAPQPTMDDLDHVVRHCVDAGIPTELIVEGERPPRSVGAEMTGYRIVQEALTNVIKHAGKPARAAVKVTYAPKAIRIEVTDDGKGTTIGDLRAHVGHGIIGMRERAELFEGTLQAGPRPGGGFRVAATIPLDGTNEAT